MLKRSNIHPIIRVIATEVIDGQWGDADDRKRKLTKAGFNYDVVQREVNRQVAKANEEYVKRKVWRRIE